jgi:hypothetical protein
LEIHFEEFVGPFYEKGGADVQVELGEAVLFGLIGRVSRGNGNEEEE